MIRVRKSNEVMFVFLCDKGIYFLSSSQAFW